MIKTCVKCNEVYERKGARLYCLPCSKINRLEVNRKHEKIAKESGKRKERYKKKHAKQVDRGIEINQKIEREDYNGNEAHGIKIVTHFVHEFSKNKTFVNKWGKPVYTKERQKAKQHLIGEILDQDHKFFQAKTWLDITMFKDRNTGDAINSLDTIADAIEAGIGINDKWYAIRKLDWYIDKLDPRIEILITQDAREHCDICSKCGRITQLKDFPEHVAKKIFNQIENKGRCTIAKVCLECRG